MDFAPPSEPPPLLNFDQVRHLAIHGWLPIDLPEHTLSQLQALFNEGSIFFDQQNEQKRSLYPASHGTECGFYRVRDEKEYLTFRYQQHPHLDLEHIARQIWQQSACLLHRILCDLSRAGSYDVHAWDHLVEGSLDLPEAAQDMQDLMTLMRLFRYYPEGGIAAEHVDIGLLTLCIGNGPGLQVLNRESKEYEDAVGPVVLIGDTCRALLRNRVRPGLHRVVGNPQGRSSIIFALRPCLKYDTDLSKFGGKGVVNMREFFLKVKGAKYNINATKNIREQQLRNKQQWQKAVDVPTR